MKYLIFFSFLNLISLSTLACGFTEECTNCNIYIYDKAFNYSKVILKENSVDEQNILEWKTYFGNSADEYSIWQASQKLNYSQIDKLIKILKKETVNFEENEKDAYWFILKNKEFKASKKLLNSLYYLAFAQKIDLEISIDENVNNYIHDDSIEIKAINNLKNIKNAFINDRYLFQLVKLHFYKNQDAYEFFNKIKGKFLGKDSSYFRSLSYSAGQNNDSVKANFTFTQIFANAPYMAYQTYSSFSPREKEDWLQLQKIKSTTKEKENLYYIFGLKYDTKKAIYSLLKLSPQSKMIDKLLYKMAFDIENGDFQTDLSDQYLNQSLSELQEFEKLVSENTNLNQNLFNLIFSIQYLYLNKFDLALKYLDKIKTDDQNLKIQMRMVKLQIITKSFDVISKTKESYFAEELFWLQKLNHKSADNLINWVHQKLAETYKNTNTLYAVLLDDQYARVFFLENSNIKNYLNLKNKQNKNLFEKYLTQNKNSTSIYYKNHNFNNIEINNKMAFNYLFNFQFQEAYKNFDSKTLKIKLSEYTFENQIIESNQFDNFYETDSKGKDKKLTLDSLLLTLIEFEKMTNEKKEISNSLKLKVANAVYSFSNEGVNSYFIRGYLNDYYLVGNLDKHMKKIKPLYEELLKSTTDSELGAALAFRLAKIERNEMYYTEWVNSTKKSNENNFSLYNLDYAFGKVLEKSYKGSYFELLKNKYQNTQYYKEVIESCETFKNWVDKIK